MGLGGAAPDLAEQLAESESLFRSLFEANILGVTIVDEQRIVEANDAFLRMVGRTRAEVHAGSLEWAAMTPPEYAVNDVRAMHLLETTGTAEPWEKAYLRPDGTRVPVLIGAATVSRDPLRAVCFALDLSERNRALERVTALHSLASALSAALSGDDVAEAILTHGAATSGACCAVLGLRSGRELILSQRHRVGAARRAPGRLATTAQAPMPEALRTAQPVLLGSRAEWLRRFPEHPPREDFEGFAAVPLIGEHGAIGCMGLGFPTRRTFDAGDLELLQVIARQGAQALERAALYEQRAHVARTLQQGAEVGLPGRPRLCGAPAAARPARRWRRRGGRGARRAAGHRGRRPPDDRGDRAASRRRPGALHRRDHRGAPLGRALRARAPTRVGRRGRRSPGGRAHHTHPGRRARVRAGAAG